MSSASFANIELEFTPPWTALVLLSLWLVGVAAALVHVPGPAAATLFLCVGTLASGAWDDGVISHTAILTGRSVGEVPFRRLRVRMRFKLPCEATSGNKM
jgi:hypothetical protein